MSKFSITFILYHLTVPQEESIMKNPRLADLEETTLKGMAQGQLNTLRSALLGAPSLRKEWLDEAIENQVDGICFAFKGILIEQWMKVSGVKFGTEFISSAQALRNELFREQHEKSLTLFFEQEKERVKAVIDDVTPDESFLLALADHRTKAFREIYREIMFDMAKTVLRNTHERIMPIMTTNVRPASIVSSVAVLPAVREEDMKLDSMEYGSSDEILSAAAGASLLSNDDTETGAQIDLKPLVPESATAARQGLSRFTRSGQKTP
jgi:hypothetical protein